MTDAIDKHCKCELFVTASEPERNGARWIGYNRGEMQIARVAKREKASARPPSQLGARL